MIDGHLRSTLQFFVVSSVLHNTGSLGKRGQSEVEWSFHVEESIVSRNGLDFLSSWHGLEQSSAVLL